MDGHLEINAVERDVPVEVECPNGENGEDTSAHFPLNLCLYLSSVTNLFYLVCITEDLEVSSSASLL